MDGEFRCGLLLRWGFVCLCKEMSVLQRDKVNVVVEGLSGNVLKVITRQAPERDVREPEVRRLTGLHDVWGNEYDFDSSPTLSFVAFLREHVCLDSTESILMRKSRALKHAHTQVSTQACRRRSPPATTRPHAPTCATHTSRHVQKRDSATRVIDKNNMPYTSVTLAAAADITWLRTSALSAVPFPAS